MTGTVAISTNNASAVHFISARQQIGSLKREVKLLKLGCGSGQGEYAQSAKADIGKLTEHLHTLSITVSLLRKDMEAAPHKARINALLRDVRSLEAKFSKYDNNTVLKEDLARLDSEVKGFGSDYLDMAPTIVHVGLAFVLSDLVVNIAAGLLNLPIYGTGWDTLLGDLLVQGGMAAGIVGACTAMAGMVPEGFAKAFSWVDGIYNRLVPKRD